MGFIELISDSRRTFLLAAATLGFGVSAAAVTLFVDLPFFLNLVYLGTAVSIAVLLYISNLKLYFGYTWILWLLSPFVRRVIDFTVGEFNPAPFPLLAPSLASTLALTSVLQHTRRLASPPYSGLVLLFVGSVIGLLSGLAADLGIVAVINGFLDYIAPLCLCFHIIAFWRLYPKHRDAALSVFVYGAAVMGVYGIYQYYFLPEWDKIWMIGSQMLSIGFPRPQELRVFSTLNSPGPYAMIMAAALIYAFAQRGVVTRVLSVPAYIGWLLALVRASWIGWLVGLVFCVVNTQGIERKRLTQILIATVILALPVLVTTGTVMDTVASRAQTLQDVQEDGSFEGRLGQYTHAHKFILESPLGRGTGAPASDSGIITVFLHLGIVGGIIYFTGFVIVAWHAWRARSRHADGFARYALSVGMMMCFLMLAGGQHAGLNGMMLWSSLSLAIAGSMYGETQRAFVSTKKLDGRLNTSAQRSPPPKTKHVRITS